MMEKILIDKIRNSKEKFSKKEIKFIENNIHIISKIYRFGMINGINKRL